MAQLARLSVLCGPGGTVPRQTTQPPVQCAQGLPGAQSGHIGQPQRLSCGYGSRTMLARMWVLSQKSRQPQLLPEVPRLRHL